MRKLAEHEVGALDNALRFADCHYRASQVGWIVCRLRDSCGYSGLLHTVSMPPDCYLQFCIYPEHCLPHLCRLMAYAKYRDSHGLLVYWWQRLFGRRLYEEGDHASALAKIALEYYAITEDGQEGCGG